MGLGINYKYKVIKNFLLENEIDLLKKYVQIRHRINQSDFDFDLLDTYDTSLYGDPIMEALLLSKMKKLEKETSLELLPTYSFWRLYTYGAELKKHKDRPSCEVSVTVMIGSCGTYEWPIFMDGKPISLNNGDAVVYLGQEVEHYREEFKGDWHTQCFLHYVDKNGKNKEWQADKRELLGLQPTKNT
jgi:hypothetical protein